MGIGHAWGDRDKLLHPRGFHGRFRTTPNHIVDRIMGILDAFNPRTFKDDVSAGNYVHDHARSNRFLTNAGSEIDHFVGGFSTINHGLQTGQLTPRDQETMKVMDKAMSPLPEDLILTRVTGPETFGLNQGNFAHIQDLEGMLVSSPGYSATTIGTPHPTSGPHVTMAIAAPKGTPALMPSIGKPTREVILPRDQEFRITSVDPDGQGGYNVMAVAVPKGESKVAPEANAPGLTPKEQAPQAPQAPSAPPPAPAPAAPNAPSAPGGAVQPRNEPIHAETVGAQPSLPTTPSAPAASTPPSPTTVPETRPGRDIRSLVREAGIESPSPGPRRLQWNKAFLGVASGKQHPADMLRDLESDIKHNEHILAEDAKDGTDSGPLPDDIKSQKALADLIRHNFIPAAHQKETPPPAKAAKVAKKAAPSTPSAKAAPAKKAVPEKAAVKKAAGTPGTPATKRAGGATTKAATPKAVKAVPTKAPAVKKAAPSAKATPPTTEQHVAALDKMTTRAEAEKYMANIKGAQLDALAKHYSVPGRENAAGKRAAIVNSTGGHKADSSAISQMVKEGNLIHQEKPGSAAAAPGENPFLKKAAPAAVKKVAEAPKVAPPKKTAPPAAKKVAAPVARSAMSKMTPGQRKIAQELGLPDNHPLAKLAVEISQLKSEKEIEDRIRNLKSDDLEQVARETGTKLPSGMSLEEKKKHLARQLTTYGIPRGEGLLTVPKKTAPEAHVPNTLAVGKTNANRVQPGEKILVRESEGTWWPSGTKTGATEITVTKKEKQGGATFITGRTADGKEVTVRGVVSHQTFFKGKEPGVAKKAAPAAKKVAEKAVPKPPTKVAQAQARQADIDKAKKHAEVAGVLEEAIDSGMGHDKAAVNVQQAALRTGLMREIEPVVNALRAGDEKKARSEMAKILKAQGITQHGNAGRIGKFDRKAHQAISGTRIPEAHPVTTIKPGFTFKRGSEDIPLSKSVVEKGVPTPAKPPVGGNIDEKTSLADLRKMAKERNIAIPGNLRTKAAIREHLQNTPAAPGSPAETKQVAKKTAEAVKKVDTGARVNLWHETFKNAGIDLPEGTPSRKAVDDALAEAKDPPSLRAQAKKLDKVAAGLREEAAKVAGQNPGNAKNTLHKADQIEKAAQVMKELAGNRRAPKKTAEPDLAPDAHLLDNPKTTVPQIRAYARDKGIAVPNKVRTKKDLIEHIKGQEAIAKAPTPAAKATAVADVITKAATGEAKSPMEHLQEVADKLFKNSTADRLRKAAEMQGIKIPDTAKTKAEVFQEVLKAAILQEKARRDALKVERAAKKGEAVAKKAAAAEAAVKKAVPSAPTEAPAKVSLRAVMKEKNLVNPTFIPANRALNKAGIDLMGGKDPAEVAKELRAEATKINRPGARSIEDEASRIKLDPDTLKARQKDGVNVLRKVADGLDAKARAAKKAVPKAAVPKAPTAAPGSLQDHLKSTELFLKNAENAKEAKAYLEAQKLTIPKIRELMDHLGVKPGNARTKDQLLENIVQYRVQSRLNSDAIRSLGAKPGEKNMWDIGVPAKSVEKLATTTKAVSGKDGLTATHIRDLKELADQPHNVVFKMSKNAATNKRLDALEKKGFIRFKGNGEFEVTDEGRAFVKNVGTPKLTPAQEKTAAGIARMAEGGFRNSEGTGVSNIKPNLKPSTAQEGKVLPFKKVAKKAPEKPPEPTPPKPPAKKAEPPLAKVVPIKKATAEPAKKAASPTKAGPVKMATHPILPNHWGTTGGAVNFHEDGVVGQAVKHMGADRNLDVNGDGEPLANVLGRLATDVVRGNKSQQDMINEMKNIRDRLPLGSKGRDEVEDAIKKMDTPPRAPIKMPDNTPAPIKDLMEALSKIPLARKDPFGNSSDMDRLDAMVKEFEDRYRDFTPAQVARAWKIRGPLMFRKLLNKHHESKEGKFEVDRVIRQALARLELK